MVFEALFYDGRSSLAKKACVQILQTELKIDLLDASFSWKISEINQQESFYNREMAVLNYGSQFPYATLEILGKEFQVAFQQNFSNLSIRQTDSRFFQNAGNRAIIAIILGVLGIMLLSYFVLIPVVAEAIAKRIPMSYEIGLGEQMFEQISKGMEVDSEQSVLATSFFKELKIMEAYPVKITVVHSTISNAFAFPGGHIVVNDEMFKIMKRKEEFAALLCHEYSHIANRHITRSLFRNLGTYLVISVVISDVNGIMAVLLQNADNLKSLSYSRSLEQEADEKGMALMQAAGQDPKGMIRLFKHLGEANAASQEVPEFLSTHPMLEERMHTIKRLSEKNQAPLFENSELSSYWGKLKALNN